MTIDAREFRTIMGSFATGVTVITMPTKDGGAWGMTANSFTSLSLEPRLVLVCIDKSTRTHQFMLEAEAWAVNILTAEQEQVSRTFALKDQNVEERTMASTPHHRGVAGAPIIEGCLSYMECRTYAKHDGGDHTIFLGEIADTAIVQPEAEPLLFFKGRYAALQPPPA